MEVAGEEKEAKEEEEQRKWRRTTKKENEVTSHSFQTRDAVAAAAAAVAAVAMKEWPNHGAVGTSALSPAGLRGAKRWECPLRKNGKLLRRRARTTPMEREKRTSAVGGSVPPV